MRVGADVLVEPDIMPRVFCRIHVAVQTVKPYSTVSKNLMVGSTIGTRQSHRDFGVFYLQNHPFDARISASRVRCARPLSTASAATTRPSFRSRLLPAMTSPAAAF